MILCIFVSYHINNILYTDIKGALEHDDFIDGQKLIDMPGQKRLGQVRICLGIYFPNIFSLILDIHIGTELAIITVHALHHLLG